MSLIIVIILSIILLYFSIKRYGKFLNPFFLEVFNTLIFLVLPQLVYLLVVPKSSTYVWSDVVIGVYIVAVFAGSNVNVKAFKIKPFGNTTLIVIVSSIIFLSLFLPTLPWLLKFGLSFKGLRLYYETIVFTKYASFYELYKKVIELIIVISFIKEKKIRLYLIPFLFILIFSGSKTAILNSVILLGVLHEEYRELKLGKIALFGLATFALLIIYHFYQTSGKDAFTSVISYFDIYDKQSMLIKKLLSGEHEYYYGEINFTSYYKYIPRFFWETKPYDYGFAILNYDFYPAWARLGYMPSFGLGTSFADFGFISIIFSGFLVGFLRNYFYNVFLDSSKNNTSFILYFFPINFISISLLICFLFLGRLKK